MAKWIVNGTTVDINPDEDSNWIKEAVVAEQHPPTATFTILQYGGLKSSKRTCSGVTKTAATKTALDACVGATVNITDHFSVTSSVFVQSVEWKEILDASNIGIGTFRWTMKMIKR